MIDMERLIRLAESGSFEPEPETKVSGLWLWALAIAGILTIAAIVGVIAT